MANCSKCGDPLDGKRSCVATGICKDCREKTHGYCDECRCYGILKDRCFVCNPDLSSGTDYDALDDKIRAGQKKVYKDECPCGLQVAQCTYHASQAG